MPSIHEVTEVLVAEWEASERERQILYSMLDDSDDESPAVQEADKIRDGLELEVNRARRPRNPVARFLQRVPRSDQDEAIVRRYRLTDNVTALSKRYNRTSQYRIEESKKSTFKQYTFNNPDEHGKDEGPSFVWEAHFRKLELTTADSADMWIELEYTQESFEIWWRPKLSIPLSVTHGWSDIKRLGRRVVIQILEMVQSQTFQSFQHIRYLKMVAEICRETVLYQMILCHSILLKDVPRLKRVFEFTAPVIHLVCGIIRKVSRLSASSTLEAQGIKTRLELIEPFVRELRNECYLLGARIGFDIESCRDTLDKGRVFDFEQDIHNESGLIRVNPLIAGKDKDEYMKRVDSIGQKQALINNAPSKRSIEIVCTGDKIDILDEKVLESIGLQKIVDIKHASGTFLGSGGYATVFRMERAEGSEPIAVKQYRTKPRAAQRIEREARVWVSIRHENIAPLLGFAVLSPDFGNQPCLVSKVYHCDLKRLIDEYKGGRELDGKKLTEERKVAFLRNVILALEFLHASGIAHGDLRAVNVLVTNDLFDDPSCYAVLNDFGMAEHYGTDINTVLDHRQLSSVNQRTSDYWVSPELLESAPREGSLARVSAKGDIYAFGVVFLEVIYEMDPYAKSNLVAGYAKANGIPPAEKADLDLLCESHWTLMQGCWETPDKRLDINEVAWAILDIHQKLIPPTPTGPDDPGMAYWSKFMRERREA